jgi:hypothetical protein
MVQSKFNLDFWFVSYIIFFFVQLVGPVIAHYRVNIILF